MSERRAPAPRTSLVPSLGYQASRRSPAASALGGVPDASDAEDDDGARGGGDAGARGGARGGLDASRPSVDALAVLDALSDDEIAALAGATEQRQLNRALQELLGRKGLLEGGNVALVVQARDEGGPAREEEKTRASLLFPLLPPSPARPPAATPLALRI